MKFILSRFLFNHCSKIRNTYLLKYKSIIKLELEHEKIIFPEILLVNKLILLVFFDKRVPKVPSDIEKIEKI